jgi:hypothetical protein
MILVLVEVGEVELCVGSILAGREELDVFLIISCFFLRIKLCRVLLDLHCEMHKLLSKHILQIRLYCLESLYI